MSYGDRMRRLREMNRGAYIPDAREEDRHMVAVVDEIFAERLRSEQLQLDRQDTSKTDDGWQKLIVEYAARIGFAGADTRIVLLKIANLAISAIIALDRKHIRNR